jgi:hypothetical protein
MRVVWIALLFMGVMIAGCTGNGADSVDDADAGVVDRDSFRLQSGKGAVAGLLVDDRFRPIHLTDNPDGEFQTTGFVLLQETGQQVRTNENGEFTFTNLDPGTYTLRVTAAGHEATPQRVTVAEGVFNELSVIARRVASDASFLLTQEYSMFIACAADYFANGGNLPCDLDLSSDSYSSAFNSDFTGLADVTHMITEMKANQEKCWEIQIRTGARYFAAALLCGDYVLVPLEVGVNADAVQNNPGYGSRYQPWLNDDGFQTIMFVDHDFRDTHQQFLGGTLCCGVGFSAGIKATFLQSVFLGEPEVDVDSYCVLC